MLLSDRRSSAQAVARFRREMKAVGKLDHPHIVRATDAGHVDGRYYLVMELIDGLDLTRLVERHGPLPVPEACELIRQAALGLEHAHQHGLVHRDVKPSNLLLDREGRVKVLDLGLALLNVESQLSQDLTHSGQVMGTLDYMAPEQANDTRLVDIRADIYSLGCTLYELLTGQPPFSDPQYCSPINKMMAHAKATPPSVQSRRSEVSDELAQLLERMMAKDSDERFATPAELAVALEPFTEGAAPAELLSAAEVC